MPVDALRRVGAFSSLPRCARMWTSSSSKAYATGSLTPSHVCTLRAFQTSWESPAKSKSVRQLTGSTAYSNMKATSSFARSQQSGFSSENAKSMSQTASITSIRTFMALRSPCARPVIGL